MLAAAAREELVVDVCRSIRRLMQRLRERARATEIATGLSDTQLLVLDRLSTGAAGSLNQLSSWVAVNQRTLSPIVRRMAGAGLVSIAPDAADARRVHVTLTTKGRALLRQRARPAEAALRDQLRR